MKKTIVLLSIIVMTISSCTSSKEKVALADSKSSMGCSDECIAKGKSGALSCKLSSPELQKRKETVLSSLKKQLIEKRESKNGYIFIFPGTDKMIDELTSFIKTERECCDFFTFNLSIRGDKSEAWLELTGAVSVKDFIKVELGL